MSLLTGFFGLALLILIPLLVILYKELHIELRKMKTYKQLRFSSLIVDEPQIKLIADPLAKHSNKHQKILEEKLLTKFPCPKCKNQEAWIQTFATPENEADAKLMDWDNTIWVARICKKCGFSSVYSFVILMAEDKTKLEGGAPIAIQCDCRNVNGRKISIAFTRTGSWKAVHVHDAEYDVLICESCGLSKFYERTKRHSFSTGGLLLVKLRHELVKKFSCVACHHSHGHSTTITATSSFSRMVDWQCYKYIALTCDECRFTELYDPLPKVGGSIFDIFR